MQNINDINSYIILDKVPNFSIYRNNWFNNTNKEIKLYNIFQCYTNNIMWQSYAIYVGLNNNLSHVFHLFDTYNFNCSLSNIYITKNLEKFLTKYNKKINNQNIIFNIYLNKINKVSLNENN